MRQKYIVTRGNRHYFVCRIPHDLLLHFPRPTLWKTLHTSNKKDADVVATAYAYQSQQLFMQLRSGMLTPDLEKRLIASFLLHGTARIQAQATGTPYTPPTPSSPLDSIFKASANMLHKGRSFADDLDINATSIKDYLLDNIEQLRVHLVNKELDVSPFDLDYLASELQKLTNIRLTASEKRTLGLKLIDAEIQLYEAEAATLEGNWSHARALQATAENDIKTPYISFAEAIDKYQEYYRASKPNVKPGTIADMEVECRTLAEIVGNVSIEAFNTMETVTRVKAVLRNYPLNRQQRYGARSLSSILKTSGYAKISPKTANEYIKRAKAIVDYALKGQMIQSHSVWNNELFQTDVAAEDQRAAYDTADVTRLIDAICTKPLWNYNPPKPERFWIVLIALFHGFRLSNIVGLTKADICQTDSGMWVFRIRTGKTQNTVKAVAINDCLLLLGFLEWVEELQRLKLFQDTSASFSAFYNRNEKRSDGYVVQGFEAKYVTIDPKKCLYSLRHTFAGEVYEVSSDFKLTADMMGHATGGHVTARYTKQARIGKLKETADKLEFHGVDLNMLEKRRIELFGLTP